MTVCALKKTNLFATVSWPYRTKARTLNINCFFEAKRKRFRLNLSDDRVELNWHLPSLAGSLVWVDRPWSVFPLQLSVGGGETPSLPHNNKRLCKDISNLKRSWNVPDLKFFYRNSFSNVMVDVVNFKVFRTLVKHWICTQTHSGQVNTQKQRSDLLSQAHNQILFYILHQLKIWKLSHDVLQTKIWCWIHGRYINH